MSVPLRIALFAGALAAVFGAAFAAGAAVDPDGAADDLAAHSDDVAAGDRAAAEHESAEHAKRAGSARAPARVVVADRSFVPGVAGRLRFRVVDRAGRTVEDFDVEHERAMHVIAVRHDLTGYRHVHPRRTADGGWEVDVVFPEAGPQRVFADFASGGESYTLAADVRAVGRYSPRELPAAATTADAGDGYAVEVAAHGDERRFSVSKDGEPVTDVEPYLGARGHLVALRERDLAFQHVHPRDDATAGRDIAFGVSLAKAGRHRLFLQFKHRGEVRTAAFTEIASASGAAGHGEDGHGH